MANTILTLKHHRKAFHVLSFFTLALLMRRVDATEFKVGGAKGWNVASDDPNVNTYNQWAETHRFQIGDSLLFVYPADKDSVLQVKKEDYDSCNRASPIASFKDGHTSFKFDKNGPYYFISGVPENCKKNEKILVVVMAYRSNKSSSTNETRLGSPPSPSPSGYIENAPVPAPMGEIAPSTPTEIAPSTPTVEPPSPSSASSMLVNAIASIGVFAGSSLLLVL
ncbi:hypothetical protein NE237_000213 [Protea cynaroides]|uniref:Phytocyanin domain-containing protein n=1 Tax=Protea cynaroides TaxID=273540 RepID=A0A9Q0KR10_9MAGN|nr:hypothetical protein NE237_000213 [Protea cynaroides]